MSNNQGWSSCLAKTKDTLRDLSFGKYPGSLYLKGKLQYSTVFGGIVTLALVTVLISYSAVQIRNTFYIENNYNTQFSIEDLQDSENLRELKLIDFQKNFIQDFLITLEKPFFQNCS